jgi:glycosyltransferase involved in cell wall biosynthesis
MEPRSTIAAEEIWCVVPVFNNGRTVKAAALGCREQLAHVLVVDDGSTDADVAALFAGTDITVLRHEQNCGKGEAIRTALRHVRERGGRWMITVDGDGQHDPRDIAKFLPLLPADGSAIVIGARRFDSDTVPESSRFGRAFSNFWLHLETGVGVPDSQSGFRAYPVEHLANLPCRGRRYDFEIEVLTRAAWAGLELKSVEIGVTYPPAGERVSSFRPFLDNLRISLIHTRLVGRRLVPVPYRKLVRRVSAGTKYPRNARQLIIVLLKENATPAGLAASAAVGTVLAVLPLISAHTLAILYVTARLNLNKIMALAIQNLYMPPFAPVACVELGYFLRHGRWLTDITSDTLFLQLHSRLFEWLLGSLILAPVAAVLAGGGVFWLARAMQGKGGARG